MNLTYRVDFGAPVIAARGIPTREMFLALEDELRKFPSVEAPIRHYFGGGMYAREMTLPKGAMATGKIHKHEHLFVISKGDVTILTEDGMKRLQAPCTFVGRPGIKRAAYAHEDTVVTAIHRTDETDLIKLEAECVAQDFEEFDQYMRALEHQT